MPVLAPLSSLSSLLLPACRGRRDTHCLCGGLGRTGRGKPQWKDAPFPLDTFGCRCLFCRKKKQTNTATSPCIQRVSWVCLQQAPSGWGQYGQHHPFTQILPSAKAAKGSPTWERGNCSVKEIPPGVSPAGAPMLSGGAGHLAVLEERAARAAGC